MKPALNIFSTCLVMVMAAGFTSCAQNNQAQNQNAMKMETKSTEEKVVKSDEEWKKELTP